MREPIQEIEHPGVVVWDRVAKAWIVQCWEDYAAEHDFPLSDFRKKHPTPWKTKPYDGPPREPVK